MPSNGLVISGGIDCRVTLEQLYGVSQVFAFPDVAVILTIDRVVVRTAQADVTASESESTCIVSMPLKRLLNVSHVNTKRSILVDADLSMKGGGGPDAATPSSPVTCVTSDLIDIPWPTVARSATCNVQLNFSTPDERSRVFSVLFPTWQRLRRLERPPPPTEDRGSNHVIVRNVEAATVVATADAEDRRRGGGLLQHVRSLQAKAGSILGEVRALRAQHPDSPVVKESARLTHQELDSFRAMENLEVELRDIQRRRMSRWGTGPNLHVPFTPGRSVDDCPHCGRHMPRDSCTTHPQRCAFRPLVCADCGVTILARDREDHDLACAVQRRELSYQRTDSENSGSSFASVTPPPSETTSPSSARQREKDRVAAVLRQQEAERRRASQRSDAPPPTASTPSSSSTTPSSTPSTSNVKCPHCGKMAPGSHSTPCAHRLIECKHCKQKVAARDALQHAQICRERRSSKSQ